MSKREPGFRVGRGPGPYGGNAWNKKDKSGRWIPIPREGVGWTPAPKKKGGCSLLLIGLLTAVAAIIAAVALI